MTKRTTFTQAQIERAIRAADATGKVAVQTPVGIAFVDPASLPQHVPTESGENSCDKAFGCA